MRQASLRGTVSTTQLLRRACRGIVPGFETLENRQLLTLVVDWPMTESPDTVIVDRATDDGSQDAFLNASATWVADRDGGTDPWAVNLEPAGAALDVGANLMEYVGGTASVSFWLRTTAIGNDNVRLTGSVVGSGDTPDVNQDIFWGWLDGTGRIGLTVPGALPTVGSPLRDTVKSARAVNDGVWHHVAMTRDSATGEIKIFVDGVLNDRAFANTAARPITTPIREVGLTQMRAPAADQFFKGQLDEFKIDNEALTDNQIALLFDPSGAAPQTPTNVAITYIGSRAVQLQITDGAGTESFFEAQASRDGITWGPTQVLSSKTGFITGLNSNTDYSFRVRAVNPFGSSPYTTPITARTAVVPQPGTGNGLLGIYYDVDGDATPDNSTGKMIARIDPQIALDFGSGAPHPAIGPDTFTVKWRGEIQPLYSEPYTFFSRSDDGFFLWLTQNGIETRIINDPTFHGTQAIPGLRSTVVNLVAGQKYQIRAEMFEGGGGAAAFLAWQSPSQPYENVPQSQLYSPAQPAPTGAPSGLTATANGSTAIVLSWTDGVAGELGYIIERSPTGAAGTFQELARVDGTTYTDVVYPQQTFHYRVSGFTLGGTTGFSNTATTSTPAIPVEPGLLGSYFIGGPAAAPVVPDVPVATRADTTINFPLGPAAPTVPGIPADDFIIRWEGVAVIPQAGVYTFLPSTDDGARLWVNGQAAVMQWVDRGNTENASPAFTFTAGQRVPIVMEMYENGGDANAFLRWRATNAAGAEIIPRDIIPSTALATQVNAPAAPSNLAVGATTATSATINFTDTALNEAEYVLQRSDDGGINWVTVTKQIALSNVGGAPANGSFNVGGLRPNTTYNFRVASRNVAGLTPTVLNVTTAAAPAGGLAGTETTPVSGDTNLTAEGNIDWSHWGHPGSATARNTKATLGAVAWEAEDQTFWAGNPTDPDGDGKTWQVVDLTTTPSANGPGTSASGGRALVSGEDAAPVDLNGGFLVYNVTFTAPGSYRLFALSRHADVDGDAALGNNDSMIVASALNTAPGATGFVTFDNANNNANYRWARGPTYNVTTAGTYTLAIGNREGGYMIDRFVLHRDVNISDANLNAIASSGQPRPGGPISNFTQVGTGVVTAVDTAGKTFSWTDGTPVGTVTGTDDAVAVTGAGNGFRFTVPASNTTERKLRVYVGVANGTGRLTATLSDGSSPVFNETLTGAAGQTFAVYEISYKSGLANETLTVEWVAVDGAQVILQAAAWSELSAPATPTNFRAVPLFGQRIALAWTDAATNEQDYVLMRKAGAGGTFQQLAILPPNTTSFADTGPFVAGTDYFYELRARGAGGDSVPAAITTTAGSPATQVFNYTSFPDAAGLTLNGDGPSIANNRLQLTPAVNDREGTAFRTNKVDVRSFENTFEFTMPAGNGADGMVWMLQNQSLNVVGGGGGGLGYAGITPSIALKYDIYNNVDQTGLYVNGVMNDTLGTGPNTAQDVRPFGLDFNPAGGNTIRVHIAYNQGVLVQTITNVANPTQTATFTYLIDIPATLGGNQAWVGFGGGTGGLNVQQEIVSWRWAEAPPPVVGDPTNLTATGLSSGRVRLSWTDGSTDEAGYIIERSSTGPTGAFTEIARTTDPAISTFFDTTGAPNTTYHYRVRAYNVADQSENTNVANAALGAGPFGNGLEATAYDERFFSGTSQAVTLDLDENLGNATIPGTTFDPETISVVWEGQIVPEFSETYSFFTASDDGIGITIIDPDTNQAVFHFDGIQYLRGMPASGFSDDAGTAALVAGKRYDVQLRFTDNLFGAGWRFGWQSPSVPREVIPQQVLHAPTAGTPRGADQVHVGEGWGNEYVVVRWRDLSVNETGYEVLRSTDPTTGFAPIASLGANAWEYRDAGPLNADTNYYYKVRALGTPANSAESAAMAYDTGGAESFNFTAFPSPAELIVNGSTRVTGNRLRITNNENGQASSAYAARSIDVTKDFKTQFDFQVNGTNAADGFTFVIQRAGAGAIGAGGGGMGYQGILTSVAVKFDFWPQPDTSTTGLYLNGAAPDDAAPASIDMFGSGVNLDDGRTYRVWFEYDADTDTLTQKVALASAPETILFQHQYTALDIATTIGGDKAFIGFTGGTGGANARQEIFNWSLGDVTQPPPPLDLTGTAGNDNFFVKRDGNNLNVFANADGSGTPIAVVPLPITQTVNFNGLDGDDTITVDMSGGDIALGGLNIVASAGNDKVRLINGDGKVLTLGALPTLNGETLDLGTADLLLTGVAPDAVKAILAAARAGSPRWSGPGIGTSAATTLTGLAPIQQGANTLVKFTYNGDANGDGRVNADDYFRIDQGFLQQPANPSYFQGDFNYDNRVNADDYFLIDQAFLGQGPQLAAAAPAAATTSSTAVVASEDAAKKASKRRASDDSLFSSKRIEKRPARRR